MGKRDPRVEAYIAKAPERRSSTGSARVHAACPDEEDMKWPTLRLQGLMCAMAAFKQHAAFGFWKGSLVAGPAAADSAGWFGRLTRVSDLPPRKALAACQESHGVERRRDHGAGKQKQPAKPMKVPRILQPR
jgi:hypothetical protein